jgi:WhiB family transcriptional regulator, redox-sensing transcriptional regulator
MREGMTRSRRSPGEVLLAGADLPEAACRDAEPTLFFGPAGHETRSERLEREASAKRLCAGCSALEACRSFALQHAEPYGVWGGLGEQERRVAIARLGRTRGLPEPA